MGNDNINKYKLKLEDSFGLIINGVRCMHQDARNDRYNDVIDFGGQVLLLCAMIGTAGIFSILMRTIHFFRVGIGYSLIVTSFAGLMLAFAYGVALLEDKFSKEKATTDKEFAQNVLKKLNMSTDENEDTESAIVVLNVETMLRYAQLNHLEKEVEQIVDKHVNIGVVSRGLEKLRTLGSEGSGDYKKLVDTYYKEVRGLEDDLFGLVLPKLTNEVNRLVETGRFDLVPDDITKDLANKYEKQLLERIEAEDA